jgi:DNA-binding transcriptional ArsR family regulator
MTLLKYLVPSRARRALLETLFLDDVRGSVSQLARRARLSFAAAHRELEAMRAAGLTSCERAGNRVEYRCSDNHPSARALRDLLRTASRDRTRTTPNGDQTVRGWLREAGAPLAAQTPGSPPPAIEEALATALELAHRDATVARVLPLVLWLQRQNLDHAALGRAATRRNERETLGLFLELAGRLGGDVSLVRAARRLRDRRRSRPRPFFTRATGRMAAASARRHTPALARRWGYSMNLGLDSFASVFARHGGGAAA